MLTEYPRPSYAVYTEPKPGVQYVEGENFYRHCDRDPNAIPVIGYHPFGNVCVAIEFIARRRGIATVTSLKRQVYEEYLSSIPSPITQKSKELGAQVAPAGICFPFKPILGNYFEIADDVEELRKKTGQDLYLLILSHESTGPCRERQYARLAETYLVDYFQDKFGHTNFDFYVAKETLKGTWQTISFLAELSRRPGWLGKFQVLNVFNEGIRRLNLIKEFERDINLALSLGPGRNGEHFSDVEALLQEAKEAMILQDLPDCKRKGIFEKPPKLESLLEPFRERLQSYLTETQRREPRGIIKFHGEIYECEEKSSSAEDIGRMLLKDGFLYVDGIGLDEYTPRFEITIKRAIKYVFNTIRLQLHLLKNRTRELAAKAGFIHPAGGHTEDTGKILQDQKEESIRMNKTAHHPIKPVLEESFQKLKERLSHKERLPDGLAGLYPFICLPGTIAKNIMRGKPSIVPSIDFDFDETSRVTHTGTRIQAFEDLIERRKRLAGANKVAGNGRSNGDKKMVG